MRIFLCIKQDLFGLIAARTFLSALDGYDLDISVFCSTKTRPAEDVSPWLGLFKVLERQVPFEFMAPQMQASGGLGKDAHLRWPWRPIISLRDPSDNNPFSTTTPDLVVSMRFSLIFPEAIINAIPYGIINVHPGPLPKYRGLFAPFWQMRAGEKTFASTLHFVDKGIDTGPIIGTHSIARDNSRSLMWHIAELYRGGAALAADVVLRSLKEKKRVKAAPQPPEGNYYKFPSDDELKEASTGLLKFVDPSDYAALMREAFALPAYDAATPERLCV